MTIPHQRHTTPTLLHPDDRILRLLIAGRSFDEVCAIGQYHRTWTPSKVLSVLDQHLRPDLPTYHPPGDGNAPEQATLTPRQAEVLDHICLGQSVAEIARQTGLSDSYTTDVVRQVLHALHAESRAEAVARIYRDHVEVLITSNYRRNHADASP